MKSRLLLLIVSLSVLAACGGSKSSTSTPSTTGGAVSLSPTSASVPTNTTAQFTATVSNSSSGVYWSVNGVIGGNLTSGTISTSGLYTAPAVVPSPATATVTATSLSDTSQSASATVTITAGTAISFTISPSTVSVYTSRTQQFSTTFNTSANTGVTWEVNSTIGGDSTHGTISSSGLYTAPQTVPSPATVTITAISQADATKTATATVTIVLGSSIVVTASSTTVNTGGTLTLTATSVNGTAAPTPIAVTWTLNCNSTVTNGCGTIVTAGGTANATATYTAPPFPPPGGGAVAITGTSTDQSALPGSTNITVLLSGGSLVGTYAYSFAGKNSGTAYASAGSITFDGSGNITGGSEDLNNGVASNSTITGGSYHIGPDGRGNATVITSAGTEVWQLVIKDNTKAFLMRADAGVTGAGTLYLQDTSKFTTASVSGNYALRLSGPAAGQNGSAAIAAAFNANGAGVLSAGKLDASQGAGNTSIALAATGVYGSPSTTTGRGTMSISSTYGPMNLIYYIVDATRAVVVDVDGGKTLRGDVIVQPAGPFSLGSYANSFAMVVSGANATVPVAIGSVFTLDGAGNVSAGVADVNTNGNTQNGVVLSGTYVVTDTATGRAELSATINGQSRKFVLYPESGGVYTALEIDGVQTTLGRAYAQASSVGASVWTGSYEGNLAGTDFINSPGEKDAVGIFIPNGGSAVTGTADVNSNGSVATAVALTGSYSPSATGRFAGTLATAPGTLLSGQYVFYVVDAKHALLMESDSSRILVGQMEKP